MASDGHLVPVRILNEFVYCRRLAYLEWVQSEWADSIDTDEGRHVHRIVDEAKGEMEAGGRLHAVALADEQLGITSRLDVVEEEDGCRVPIDFKRGKAPDVPKGAWEPERVQICAQGLLLRAHGHECSHGYLYFAGSRQRVRVDLDEPLVKETLATIEGVRALVAAPIPAPLEDSPKCPRCSLVGICLPDEVTVLAADGDESTPRQLVPARDDAKPAYVLGRGHRIGVRGGELVVSPPRRSEDAGGPVRRRLFETSQVAVLGNATVSAQAVRQLCERDIPICWFTSGGWFYGVTRGMATKNVHLRIAQHVAAADGGRSLEIARGLVAAKIRNARTLLRRNHPKAPGRILRALRDLARQSEGAERVESLLGFEGMAARHYFGCFGDLLKGYGDDFEWSGRNRRPPADPVNALLSFAYALLAKEWTVVLYSVGFDPFVGFYHRPRHGRPALALDMMESFRPLIADSVVLRALNNGELRPHHFLHRGPSVALTRGGKAAFVRSYERRMRQEVTHPVFGYRISYRRVLEVQARLLGRYLANEIPDYPSFETR